ncbi:MAG: YtxH domain-containing protein [Chloroflexi bacterium]|nr:YtxH domain-containing protein [Chloroflexota bacterium]
MRRIAAFVGGVASGTAVGTVLGLLLTPASGETMREGLRQHIANAREAGQAAAEQKQAELEARWQTLTTPQDRAEDADIAED